MEEYRYLYKTFECFKNFNDYFMYLIRWKKGGGALMYAYLLEHIIRLYYRTTRWILMKLGRDEVLMAQHIHKGVSAISAQGRIQGRAKIGHKGWWRGPWGVPFLKKNFFRTEGYSNKQNAWQWFRSMWEEVLLFLVPFRSQIFDAILTSFWTSSFWLF